MASQRVNRKLNKGDIITERLKSSTNEQYGRLTHKRKWLLTDCLGKNSQVQTFKAVEEEKAHTSVVKVCPLDSTKQHLSKV